MTHEMAMAIQKRAEAQSLEYAGKTDPAGYYLRHTEYAWKMARQAWAEYDAGKVAAT